MLLGASVIISAMSWFIRLKFLGTYHTTRNIKRIVSVKTAIQRTFFLR